MYNYIVCVHVSEIVQCECMFYQLFFTFHNTFPRVVMSMSGGFSKMFKSPHNDDSDATEKVYYCHSIVF